MERNRRLRSLTPPQVIQTRKNVPRQNITTRYFGQNQSQLEVGTSLLKL